MERQSATVAPGKNCSIELMSKRGFTLIELLVVIAIIAMIRLRLARLAGN